MLKDNLHCASSGIYNIVSAIFLWLYEGHFLLHSFYLFALIGKCIQPCTQSLYLSKPFTDLNWSWTCSRITRGFWKLVFNFAVLGRVKQCQETNRLGLGGWKCSPQQMVSVWIFSNKRGAVLVYDVNLIYVCIQLFRNKWITICFLWKLRV